jgi:hypothetical protein
MPLKLKKSQTPSEPSSTKDELSGPWGRINPESQSAITLRFSKKPPSGPEEIHSYPYRVLSSWHWSTSVSEEELKIEAGSDLVFVKGRGLDRLVEALDRNSLEFLSEASSDLDLSEENGIRISSITVASFREDNSG